MSSETMHWRREFQQTLQQRHKWTRTHCNVQVNDIVLLKDIDLQLARVVEIFPSSDGLLRKVKLFVSDPIPEATGQGARPAQTVERPINKLVLLILNEGRTGQSLLRNPHSMKRCLGWTLIYNLGLWTLLDCFRS